MSKTLEMLQNKIENVDKAKLKDLVSEIKTAADDGKITEDEKQELIKTAKEQLGDPFSGYNI